MRYFEILNSKKVPYYLICKRIKVPKRKELEQLSLKELFKIHEKKIKELFKIDKLEVEEIEKMPVAKDNLLTLKEEIVKKLMENCMLCERKCKVNRFEKEGFCKLKDELRIFGIHLHYGEEYFLIPSLTIFFSGCNMRCIYCQNAPESIEPKLGKKLSIEEIVNLIKNFGTNAKNINLVGGEPTVQLLNIIKILERIDLKLPIIWNSNSYYSKETSLVLEGLIDLYLLDFRYFSNDCSLKLSLANNYVEAAKRNIKIANKYDLLIRILVIPSHINCDAIPILKWIKENLKDENLIINLLSQYYPAFEAFRVKNINRRLTKEEWEKVSNFARSLNFKKLLIQEPLF